ncbi:unnamed protein product [Peniophora sp. CBMAI 1063]|nr:unnamed protein product [Peniophora sp. CBMAI 1063]
MARPENEIYQLLSFIWIGKAGVHDHHISFSKDVTVRDLYETLADKYCLPDESFTLQKLKDDYAKRLGTLDKNMIARELYTLSTREVGRWFAYNTDEIELSRSFNESLRNFFPRVLGNDIRGPSSSSRPPIDFILWQHCPPDADEHEKYNLVRHMPAHIRCLQTVRATIRRNASPSRGATHAYFLDQQRDPFRALYNGRYTAEEAVSTRLAAPIEIYCSVFARLKARLHDETLEVPEDIRWRMSDCIEQQLPDGLRGSLVGDLEEILGVKFSRASWYGDEGRAVPDSVVFKDIRIRSQEDALSIPIATLGQRESADDAGNPQTRGALLMQCSWLETPYREVMAMCCCPTLILSLDDSWLKVDGSVFTDRWIVQHLFGIHIGHPGSALHARTSLDILSRHLYALRLAIPELGDWYTALADNPVQRPLNEHHPRFYPELASYPVAGSTTGERISFEYLSKLGHYASYAYLARTVPDGQPGELIVVKITESYGQDAHAALAAAGYAPKILFCGPACAELPKGMTMVVMQYIEGEVLERMESQDELPESFFQDLCRAIDVLRREGLVHGDLRAPNIMVDQDKKLKIIDFDWAGKDGQVRYPYEISPKIAWHPEVKEFAPIRGYHDEYMLRQLLPPGFARPAAESSETGSGPPT